MKKLVLLLMSVTLLSCNFENRKPEFKRFENIVVEKFTSSKIIINADAIVYNPNGISIYLNKTEIDVIVDEKKVSHISQTNSTEISKNSEFKVPIKATFKPSDLFDKKATILDIVLKYKDKLKNKNINLNYDGNMEFGVGEFTFAIPVEYQQEVLLK